MHRFFVSPSDVRDGTVTFSPAQSRQISRVLRLGIGAKVIALDGSGEEMVVRLAALEPTASGPIDVRRRNTAEPRLHLTLYQALLKGSKFETVLQKGTEIGVAAFVPVHTSRTIVRPVPEARKSRYEAIVREAAEQSGRGTIPTIALAMPYQDALDQATTAGPVLVLWEAEETVRLMEEAKKRSSDQVSLFIGPEGGFSCDEIAVARAMGAQTVTLGPRILRAETAGIVAPALVLTQADNA
jgi:16S rRNA (uracil1498-N3)-methyltransferase